MWKGKQAKKGGFARVHALYLQARGSGIKEKSSVEKEGTEAQGTRVTIESEERAGEDCSKVPRRERVSWLEMEAELWQSLCQVGL